MSCKSKQLHFDCFIKIGRKWVVRYFKGYVDIFVDMLSSHFVPQHLQCQHWASSLHHPCHGLLLSRLLGWAEIDCYKLNLNAINKNIYVCISISYNFCINYCNQGNTCTFLLTLAASTGAMQQRLCKTKQKLIYMLWFKFIFILIFFEPV